MTLDPATTNPDHYKVVFENDRVRVLEYRDEPGEQTTLHEHPDSVMYTLTSFRSISSQSPLYLASRVLYSYRLNGQRSPLIRIS